MHVTYDLTANELNQTLLESIKKLFGSKPLHIVISDSDPEEIALNSAINEGMQSESISKQHLIEALNADRD